MTTTTTPTPNAKLAWAALAEHLASDVADLGERMERRGTNDSIDLNDIAPELRRLTEIASLIVCEEIDTRLRDFVDETLRIDSEMLPGSHDWPGVLARFRATAALLDKIDQLDDGEAA